MPTGFYISVPFCRSKCSYCNFASGVFSRAQFTRYVDRACADIANAQSIARDTGASLDSRVDTVYLGGGTPTTLAPEDLRRIFAQLRGSFDVSLDAEITVECAPGTLDPPVLAALVECGVNRISFGVQSFVDQEAAAVGRLHTRDITLTDIERLRTAGITNINLDLIAGLPHQTAESWEYSVSEVIATGVRHASVYMLEVDEDSRLGREVMAGGTRYHAHFVPDDYATADFYQEACRRLNAAGIPQYEISNFARPGFESRHNLKYWTRQPYFGVGVDAHSMLLATALSDTHSDAIRLATPDTLEEFVGDHVSAGDAELLSIGEKPAARTTEEALPLPPSAFRRDEVPQHQAVEESFFLGLRLNRGMDLRETRERFGSATLAQHLPAIERCLAECLIEESQGRLRLTPRGRLLSNEVFARFLLDANESTITAAK